MIPIENLHEFDFELVEIDSSWNIGMEKEFKIHQIHSYPAKFPAFIATKAIEYSKENGLAVNSMADIFCGCGTSAFEAKRNGIDFWGCDINPVATLIANAKSQNYSATYVGKYLKKILEEFQNVKNIPCYKEANERIRYWYKEEQYRDLVKLKIAIETSVPARSKYKLFFLCAFSNILKATSVWLTKSIKPQVDPNKKPGNVLEKFNHQCKFMVNASNEIATETQSKITIQTKNILQKNLALPKVDLIVTSPPYVTSYEYADLHQLSSLWLGYTDDHRKLRAGSIGSLYHDDYDCLKEWRKLNETGYKIVTQLYNNDKSKSRSVAKYFLDMQKVAARVYQMLNNNGISVFVIGNTEYKGVRIDNAKHLAESLFEAGFDEVLTSKRKISKKILTPYRDENGKFSTNKSGRKIYSEEFIVVGRKLCNEKAR